jgi:hypothetical protein
LDRYRNSAHEKLSYPSKKLDLNAVSGKAAVAAMYSCEESSAMGSAVSDGAAMAKGRSFYLCRLRGRRRPRVRKVETYACKVEGEVRGLGVTHDETNNGRSDDGPCCRGPGRRVRTR